MPSAYNEFYARHKLAPLCYNLESPQTQANSSNFKDFLYQCYFNHTFYSYVDKVCDIFDPKDPNITCVGALFASHDDEAIILIFRGSTTQPEVLQQEDFYNLTVQFPGGGTVHKFYYNGFSVLWNNGLRDALLSAKNAYPSYELWVTGLSLGAGLSSIAAPYISQMKYFDKNHMKLMNFGAMRTMHPDLANRYPSLVPWAYRVTHRNDIVPHWFQRNGYLHYKNEIWYNNSMSESEQNMFVECDSQESLDCSMSVSSDLWTWKDHQYFDGRSCVKFTNHTFSQ